MGLRLLRDPAVLLPLAVAVVAVCDASPARTNPIRRSSANSAIIFPDERRTTTPSPLSGCVDYAGRQGRCVTINMCAGLRRLLATDGPTPETIRRLRAGGCGAWRGGPLVCCGAGDPPTPPPPEEHPNLAILERGEPCGIAGFHPNIFGGNETGAGEFPWVAALAYEHPNIDGTDVNCGGALIGLQYVLTAAHCVANLPEGFRLHSVRLGEHDLSTELDCGVPANPDLCLPPPQVFNVTETIVHPRYNEPTLDRNDIALLRLDRPAVENEGVAKVCLPLGVKRITDPTGASALVAGFGLTESGFSSDVMLKVSLPVLPQQPCAEEIGRRGRVIGPGQLCAGGERGLDSCVGDSGGPLMLPDRFGPPYCVIGVTSFGPTTCGVGNVPGVYTRVTEYLDWILENVHE